MIGKTISHYHVTGALGADVGPPRLRKYILREPLKVN